MKILTINTYFYLRGGDCRLALTSADLLRHKGHEVTYFSMQGDQNLPCEDDKYFISEIDYRKLLIRKNPAQILKVLWRSIYSIEARKNIANLLDRYKPDIAHIHSIRHHITTSVIPELKKRKIPVVWTLHDYKELCPNTTFYNGKTICQKCQGRKYRHVIYNKCKKGSYAASLMAYLESRANGFLGYSKHVDAYISPSKFLKKKFIESGYEPDRLIHIPNFIETDQYKPQYEYDNYLLFIGRLEKEKGLKTLIRAYSDAVQKNNLSIALKIAGTGSMDEELINELSRFKSTNVHMLGYLHGQELEKLTKKAMAVVIPSEWYENYPYSALEAMVYGKPVIASRIGGLPELVIDNVSGMLYKPFDHKQLASKIGALAMMPKSKIIAMGKEARKSVERNNNPTIYLERLMQVYSILQAKNRLSPK